MALESRRYNRVIYYGHALADGVTLAPQQRITAPQIAHALKGSGVAHVDILGCDSSSIGALLATLVPGLTVGTLRGKRFDDFKVDPSTMKIQDFTIVPMQISLGNEPAIRGSLDLAVQRSGNRPHAKADDCGGLLPIRD